MTDGTAVAADDANGVLKPATFTDADGTSATIERISWEPGTGSEPGTVKLKLSPQTVIAAHIVDFIELDGTTSLSLNADVATLDAANNTLSWPVASQPWHDGDELMLRIRTTLLPNGPADSNPVSAAEACNLTDTPYDALVTSATPIGEARAEIRYSGSDEHVVTRISDHEGVLLGKYEAIVKDRTRYYRESTPDNSEIYGEWQVAGTDLPRSFPLPCLDTSGYEEGASGSSDEPHFTTERFLSEEEGAERTEYWADTKGRPVRARRTQFLPDYDEVTNTGFFVTEFTYSDYGEPNIIAAPCASAAPDQANNPGLMRDCINLLGLKDTLRGTATLNWSVDTAITSWDGVTVQGSPGRITELLLTSKSLTGTIPPDLWRLDGLENLSLENNQLTGTIPTELTNLANLQKLLLDNNQLTGCIPPALRNVDSNDLDSLGLQDCATVAAPTPTLTSVSTPTPTSTPVPTATPTSDVEETPPASECDERYTIYSGPNFLPTESFHGSWSTGTLEQQGLDDDTIVHAEMLNSEIKIVETETVPFRIRSFFNYPPPYPKYMTVTEMELEVIEYLTGEGPDRITAVVEGQVGFDDWAARHCAKSIHEHDVSEPLDIDRGIAYLKSTDDPDIYYLGLALNNFATKYSSNQGVALSSVWLPFVGNGEFYNRNEDEWNTLEDIRHRIATLTEEYGRYGDGAKWRMCVRGKYFSHGRRRGEAYGLAPLIPGFLPTQIIHFRGADAPVKVGTTIWQHPIWPQDGEGGELAAWLDGQDAGRFEITYRPEIDLLDLHDRWQSELIYVYGVYWANWTPKEDASSPGVARSPGYTLTATEDLPQSTYRFTLEIRSPDFVDCGQETDSTEYVVAVTEPGGPTQLPPPPRLSVREKTSDHIVIDISPVAGATKYLLSGLHPKPYEHFEPIVEVTGESSFTIRRDELECDRWYWIGAQSFGDGQNYIEYWGEPLGYSDWVKIITRTCVPEQREK